MNNLLILQAIVSVLLIITILMQQRGASLGSAFGGQETGYYNRRGPEKKLYFITIILGTLFILLSFLNVVLF